MAEMREQVKNELRDLTYRARQAIVGPEDHTVCNVLSLAAGIGVGLALGVLFAPVSGEETRHSIAEKVQDARSRLRGRFSPAGAAARSSEP